MRNKILRCAQNDRTPEKALINPEFLRWEAQERLETQLLEWYVQTSDVTPFDEDQRRFTERWFSEHWDNWRKEKCHGASERSLGVMKCCLLCWVWS